MFKNIGKDFGKELGERLETSSKRMEDSVKEMKKGIIKSSENIQDGLVISALIAVFGWITVTLIKN